ncbi:MAG: hypothetical protein KDK39_13565 [Leptospiraceae bacterium]|nr:hypothetical protein [Leptospiraceae bacterium]
MQIFIAMQELGRLLFSLSTFGPGQQAPRLLILGLGSSRDRNIKTSMAMLKQYQHYLLITLLTGLILGLTHPAGYFTHDPQHKLIQAYSLWQNHFQSEELVYPWRDQDPDFSLYAYRETYLIHVGDRYLGQYPLFFSAIGALIYGVAGASALPLVGLLFTLAVFLFCGRLWGLQKGDYYIGVIAAPILLFGLDYTETNWLMGISLLGLTVMFRSPRRLRWYKRRYFYGAALAGLGVFLRLEMIPFFAAIWLAVLAVAWRLRPLRRPLLLRMALQMAAGFALTGLFFMAFNYWDYGHPLGPRFLVNVHSADYGDLKAFSLRVLSLLFWRENGFGIFGAAPWLAVALLFVLLHRRYQRWSWTLQILFISILIMIPLLVGLAPNDGVFNPFGPRYLALVYFPAVIVVSQVRRDFKIDEGAGRWLLWVYRAGLGWSALLFIVAVLALRLGAGSNVKFQKELAQLPGDVRLIGENRLLYKLGLQYFDPRPTLTLYSQADLEEALTSIKQRPDLKTILLLQGPPPPELSTTQKEILGRTGALQIFEADAAKWKQINDFADRLSVVCRLQHDFARKGFTARLFRCQ